MVTEVDNWDSYVNYFRRVYFNQVYIFLFDFITIWPNNLGNILTF